MIQLLHNSFMVYGYNFKYLEKKIPSVKTHAKGFLHTSGSAIK